MEVSSSVFRLIFIQLETRVRRWDLIHRTVWIIPAMFNHFRFLNHPRAGPNEDPGGVRRIYDIRLPKLILKRKRSSLVKLFSE